jgi:hypothetical protein
MYQPESVQAGEVKDEEGNEYTGEMVESGQEEPLPKATQKKAVGLSPKTGSIAFNATSGSSSSVQSRTGTPRRKTALTKNK